MDDTAQLLAFLVTLGILALLAIGLRKANTYLGIPTHGTYRSKHRAKFTFLFWMTVAITVYGLLLALFGLLAALFD